MPHFGPIKRRELIACLRRLGFSGPYAGGRHEFMQRSGLSLTIPNRTAARSAPVSWRNCCVKLESREKSGTNSEIAG